MNYLHMIDEGTVDDVKRLLVEAELVKQLLTACSIMPGARIDIIVHHNEGHFASAHLYDHAALVQSLIDALEYFQSEL